MNYIIDSLLCRGNDVNKKNVLANFNLIRTIPAFLAYNCSKKKELIDKDIEAWITIHRLDNAKLSKYKSLNWLLVYSKEFRNLFYNRIGNIIIIKLLEIFYHSMPTLYISTKDIGGGLFISHGFSTIIVAKSIGENCWINQQVTIGYNNTPTPPTIGNNVRIAAGAIVIGDVVIGDNSTIGAGSVIAKDVPPNSVVIGNPPILLRQNGELVNRKL